MIIKIIMIFAAGVAVDLLLTRYTRAVAERKIGWATLLSGFITIVNFFLLSVILKDSFADGIYNIVSFASGNTLGTYLALRKT
jgi:hypothetical protein